MAEVDSLRQFFRFAIILAAGLAMTACSQAPGDRNSVETAQAALLIPASEPSDWVSYGDHVLVVTVSEERELPDTQVASRHEGLIMRDLRLTVREVLWSRAGADAAPQTMQATASGWIVRKGKRTAFTSEGMPRLEVGSTYITAVYRDHTDKGGDGWSSFSTIPYEQQQIGKGDNSGGKLMAQGVLSKTAGQPAAAISQLLSTTSPDPISIKYSGLDGPERYRATMAEKFPVAVPRTQGPITVTIPTAAP
ncbi:hypothetical protein ACPA54_15150 [Uniformispora flossi]|uniref:hypothetical protein n=1 Tax=Uniformispora flossi TaxID=3390723 RepID=UPI003C2DA9E0